MELRFLFPCMPYSPHIVEPMFEAQWEMAQQLDLKASRLSYEDMQQEERLVVRPPASEDEILVLRGWMMKRSEYGDLVRLGAERQWRFLTSPLEYARCHFLGGWLEALAGLTPETLALPCEELAVTELLNDWGRAFVKDEVKSYTAEGLPIVESWEETLALKVKMDLYRGEDVDQLFFRRVEDFIRDSELRLFVLQGQVHHPSAPPAALALGRQVAERIASPFYSVDVVQRADGVWRVVELGDGQVSDLKEWTPEQFFPMWKALAS
jgi:hypothetical protein